MSLSADYALDLFRRGFDTFDIARKLGVTESTVLRLLAEARDRERRHKAVSA
jgi:DNA-binding transcriptional regulator LsrR (DeoR family)